MRYGLARANEWPESVRILLTDLFAWGTSGGRRPFVYHAPAYRATALAVEYSFKHRYSYRLLIDGENQEETSYVRHHGGREQGSNCGRMFATACLQSPTGSCREFRTAGHETTLPADRHLRRAALNPADLAVQ